MSPKDSYSFLIMMHSERLSRKACFRDYVMNIPVNKLTIRVTDR